MKESNRMYELEGDVQEATNYNLSKTIAFQARDFYELEELNHNTNGGTLNKSKHETLFRTAFLTHNITASTLRIAITDLFR